MPATAAAASACSGSSPRASTVVDGAGGSACAAIAQVMIASSWARTCSDVRLAAVGSIHTERPSDARRAPCPGGSRSTSPAEQPVGGSFEDLGPPLSGSLGHRWLGVADRLQHVGSAPRRALL